MSEAAKPWAPEKCPITQRPLFMWIEHHKTGEMVPTYGGPYDSYTLAEFDGEDFVCERFDHDAGGWLVDCVEGLGVKLVDDQSLVIDPNNTRYDEIEAFAAAPVAAQPDVTQQTLNDVMAGIPARDAEIAALRKEIETLQAAQAQQYVSGGNLADRLDVLADTASPGSQMQSDLYAAATIWRKHQKGPAAQQPVSGADGLPLILHDLNTSAGGRGFVAEYFESRVGRYDFTRYIRDRLAADFACALAAHLSQQDVLQAEVLDMVRMLEANEWADHCGQSELGKRLEWAITALQNRPQNIPEIIPEPDQQDADKVDAERYRAWRDAAVTNSTPFVRAMRDTLPPEAREGKPRWPTAAEWDAAIDAARKEQA